MAEIVKDEVEQALKKAAEEEAEKASQKAATEAAEKAAKKAAEEAAAKAATDSAQKAIAAGTATEEQKMLGGLLQKIIDNPAYTAKVLAGGLTAAAVAYHMYKNKETDPLQAIAEMTAGDAKTFLDTFFGPFKNWILGGLGIIFLGLLIFLIYKLASSNSS